MVTHAAGGAVWPAVADEIRRRGRRHPLVIISVNANMTIVNYLLGQDPRYKFVAGHSPLAPHADLILTDETPFTDLRSLSYLRKGHFVPARRFRRPRDGAVVTLYARPGELR
jgi:hypothetical protein